LLEKHHHFKYGLPILFIKGTLGWELFAIFWQAGIKGCLELPGVELWELRFPA